MDSASVAVQILVTLGGIFGGLFAIIKYFLNHLEKKNGHMERIAERFAESSDRQSESIQRLSEEIKLSNANHLNMLSVIDKNTRTHGDVIKYLSGRETR